MRKIFIMIVPVLLFSQTTDTIFGVKLRGIQVQKFSPGTPCKFDSFIVSQSGEWVILRGYARISGGVIVSGDIIETKLKGMELDSAKVSTGVFFNGFSVSGPDPNGYITLNITRTNGTSKSILRTKLLGTRANAFSTTFQIDSFYTSGPDANGYVWLLVTINQPLGEHEKPPEKGKEVSKIILKYDLEKVSPNPAREFTRVFYSIPKKEHVKIYVYDKTGKLLSRIVDEYQPPGIYRIFWGLVDEKGNLLPDGEYFIKIIAGKFEKTEKILILK